MFKFGFSNDGHSVESGDAIVNNIQNNVRWFESREIKCEEVNLIENCNINTLKIGDVTVKHISSDEVISILKYNEGSNENCVLNADQNHSDLVTGIYEGGLKVWECTHDLTKFINESGLNFTNSRVLDLGCGAGIIGILCALKGAYSVFQDYNSDVIKSVTIPNVFLNQIPFACCRFYSGDWESFLNLIESYGLQESDKFDYIFTSETIYNTNNYHKLINIFRKLLKRNGVIYLAAKSYYFGVGGGIAEFEGMLFKEDIFNITTIWECTEGVKRSLIKIVFK